MTKSQKPQKKRIVFKVGTNVLVDKNNKLSSSRLKSICDQLARLSKCGNEVLLVSSGAVGLGRRSLPKLKNSTLVAKQALASVGQAQLIEAYRKNFNPSIHVAQILVTHADLSRRRTYVHLRETIEELLKWRVIPIINENDTLSVEELSTEKKSFGDNDKLSAIVSAKIDADILVLLTDVDGLFTSNPKKSTSATLISEINSFSELRGVSTLGKSAIGRGGMTSKLDAAQLASMSGVETFFVNGLKKDRLKHFVDTLVSTQVKMTKPHTRVVAVTTHKIKNKKRWLQAGSGLKGAIRLNEGAVEAVKNKNASVLAVGITQVIGNFKSGDVIQILNSQDSEIGRGISFFSSKELDTVKGLKSSELPKQLSGESGGKAAIHRNNLILF